MVVRRGVRDGRTSLLVAVYSALMERSELREGASIIEADLDSFQHALDDVRCRNLLSEAIERGNLIETDLTEDDWEIWDCCQARIAVTVDVCRNLGYSVSRGDDGRWRVQFTGVHWRMLFE